MRIIYNDYSIEIKMIYILYIYVKNVGENCKIDVPKEMVDITRNGKVTIKKTLTNTNNISKSNKEPSIILKAKDITSPKYKL